MGVFRKICQKQARCDRIPVIQFGGFFSFVPPKVFRQKMKCLDLLSISDLLVGGAPDPAQLAHLRECPKCQLALDQLAEQPDLNSYRDALTSRLQRYSSSSDICKDLVDKLRSPETLDDHLQDLTNTPTDTLGVRLAEFSPGSLIDHYLLIKELGRGGMSTVLEALDTRLNRHVAIKVIFIPFHHSRAAARFEREATAVASIQHPNVITIYGSEFPERGLPYLVMELVRGESLRERIESGKGVEPRTTADWIAKVADGLQAAHDKGLLHRDIKPGNILLASSSTLSISNCEPKLADFGLAREIDGGNELTQSGYLAATPAYASPEQILNPDGIDQRSDVYSLAVTLYETLTGTTPFRGSTQAILQQIVDGEFIAPRRLDKSVPQDLETICLKGMNHDPSHRYQTAAQFAADLRRWLNGESIEARPSSRLEKSYRWAIRNPRVATLMACVAILWLALAVGSTAVAIVFNAKNAQLKVEAEKARMASAHAHISEARAQEQRELALDTLNDLINKVQAQLAGKPSTLKLREELLRTAFQGLQRITNSTDRDRLERATIDAHSQMARIMRSLGDTENASKQIDLAIELCELAVKKSPENLDFQASLAQSLTVQAEIYRDAFDNDRLASNLDRIVQLRTTLAAARSDDFLSQRNLVACQQQLADLAAGRNQPGEALNQYTQANKILADLSVRFPDENVKRDQMILENRIANVLLRLGRNADAEAHFHRSLALCEATFAEAPLNTDNQTDLAFVLARIARMKIIQRQFESALAMAKRAAGLYAAVADSNPDDVRSQSLVGSAESLLFEVNLAMGYFEDALVAANRGFECQMSLAEKFPQTTKYFVLAAENMSNVAQMHMRLGDFEKALEKQRIALDTALRTTQAADYSDSGPYAIQVTYYTKLVNAFALMLKGEEAILAQYDKPESDARLAMALLSLSCTQKKDADRLIHLGNRLDDVSPLPEMDQAFVLLLLARAYALAYSQIDDASQKQSMLEHCIVTCERIIRLAPHYKEQIVLERDFWPLEREELWKSMLGP